MKVQVIGAVALLIAGCSYQRIGDLTFISNRNIDRSREYQEKARNVSATAKMKKDDALEIAIDKLTEEHAGEFVMNAKIYVKSNGKRIKIEGDVWGN